MLTPFIHHTLTECEVALLLLLGAWHQIEWRSKHLGSGMKDLFQGWKQEATTEALRTHGSRTCVFLWTENKSSVLYISTYGQVCSYGADAASQKNFVKNFCISPWLSLVMFACLTLFPLPSLFFAFNVPSLFYLYFICPSLLSIHM